MFATIPGMSIDDFQSHSAKSAAITDKNVAALAHRTLGITGEAGISANTLKRVIRDKNGVADGDDIDVVEERLGDVMYYVAVLADFYDLKLSDIAARNMEQSSAFHESRQ